MDDIVPIKIKRRTDAALTRYTSQIHKQQSINVQQPTEPAVQNKTPHNPSKSRERHDNSYSHVTLQDLAQKEQQYKEQKVQIERDIAHISAEIYTRKKCQEFNRASQRVRDKLISMNTVLRELQHLLHEGSQGSDRKHRVQTFSNHPHPPPPAEQSISASPFSNPLARPGASPKTKTPTPSTQFERSSHGAMFTARNIAVLAGIINAMWNKHLEPVRSWLSGDPTSSNASDLQGAQGQPGETLIASIEKGLSNVLNDSNGTPNLSNRTESICWWDSIGVMISSTILFPTMYISETYWSLSEKDIIGRIKSALEKWEELWYGKKDETGSQSSAVSYFKEFMQCVSEITESHGGRKIIKLNEVVAMSNESDVAELVAKHQSLKKDLRSTLSNLEFAQKWAHDKRNQIPKIDP